MRFRYFAYGSNLLTARLVARCPSARALGVAQAPGHALEFSKQGADGAGSATIVPREGATTPGVLYEIERAERPVLDRFESLGTGYLRPDDFHVAFRGETLAVSTYVAISTLPGLVPFDWYLALIVAGAEEHGLQRSHVDFLRATGFRVDDNIARQRRIAAMKALAEHGIDDTMSVLRPRGRANGSG